MNENTSSALLVALIGAASLTWDRPAAFVLAVVTCALATVSNELREAASYAVIVEKGKNTYWVSVFVAGLSWLTAVAALAALFI